MPPALGIKPYYPLRLGFTVLCRYVCMMPLGRPFSWNFKRMRLLKLLPDNTKIGFVKAQFFAFGVEVLQVLTHVCARLDKSFDQSSPASFCLDQRNRLDLHYPFADVRGPNTVRLHGCDPVWHRGRDLLFHLRCGSIVAVPSADYRAGRDRRAPSGASGRIEVR